MEKVIYSEYKAEAGILLTQLCGLMSSNDILRWENSLLEAAGTIPAGTTFKMFVNLKGFKASNFEVHKQFRIIIPTLLSKYGYRIGYLNMFPEADITIQNFREIQCIAMANVHQDETKMMDYQAKFSTPTEQYFTDEQEAWDWISQLNVNQAG